MEYVPVRMSLMRPHEKMIFHHDYAAEEIYDGVSKNTRSSDSWKDAFVRKVREIDVAINWSISMLVVRKGC